MKRLILSCSIVAALAISCAEQGGGNSYQINGSVINSDLEGSTIYLSEAGNRAALDSAVVVEGKFEMRGNIEHPAILMLASGRNSAILTTGAEATVTIDEAINVEQSEELKLIGEMTAATNEINMAFNEFYQANRADMDAVYERYDEINQEIAAIYDSYLAENGDNLVGAYTVMRKVGDVETLEQLDSLIALAPLSKDMFIITSNRNTLIQVKKTAVGEPFTDFEGSDIEGNPSKLSDFVGKGNYVLVDFWASWCGPCRAEMPNLKNVYEKHIDNGLVLLGVNVWDKMDACLEAIDSEGMTWPILYASGDNTATESYGIKGIPTIILFAPDGTIVDRTARGEAIMTLIDEVYAQ